MKDYGQLLLWLHFCGFGSGLVVGGGALVVGGGSFLGHLGVVCTGDGFH